MGPFYVLVSADTGQVVGSEGSSITLYRNVGPHFFENAKINKQIVRYATIQLVGAQVLR